MTAPAVPEWVPQNIAEVADRQGLRAQMEVYEITGLWTQRRDAERILAYIKQ